MTAFEFRSGWSRREFLRTSALTAAGAIAVGSAGCGSDDEGASGSLSFTYWGSPFEKDAVAKAVRGFQGMHDGLKVQGQHVPDNYDTKINTLIAANKAPDLAYLGPAMAMRLGEQGKLVNILDYAGQHSEIADLLPSVVHQWAPDQALNQLAVEMMLLWYNADLFSAAGVTPPAADPTQAWTWDDYVSAADKLTVDADGKHPSDSGFDPKSVRQWGTLAPTWGPAWYGMLRGNGADLISADGKRCLLDSAGAVEVLQAISDLMYEHRVAPTPTQTEAIGATSAIQLKTKRVAMIIDGQWALLDLGKSGFKYDVGFLPRFQEPLTANLCNANAVFAGSKQKDRAVELLIYLSDPAKVDLYASGLWMPLQTKYYTDEKAIASWTDNPVHPAGYRKAAVQGLLDYSVAEPAYTVKNFEAFDKRYTPVLEKLWTGKERDARKVAKEAVAAGSSALRGVYPGTRENGGGK